MQGIDIEKIKNTFVAILRDIKKCVGDGELPGYPAAGDVMRQLLDKFPNPDDCDITSMKIANVATQLIGQVGAFDGETSEQFKKLVRMVIDNMGDGDKKDV